MAQGRKGSLFMQNLLRISGFAAAVAFAAFGPSAIAQENMRVFTCQSVGGGSPEPLGDRDGHLISVEQGSCRVEGAYAGGVSTDTIIWEWDGAKAVELSNVGVVRKPGSTLAWQGSGGKLTLTMTDGKVTGCSGSGRGVNTLATGDWAKLAGKGYTWTAKCVGPASQYTVEAKDE
jgi:hypothetical protein